MLNEDANRVARAETERQSAHVFTEGGQDGNAARWNREGSKGSRGSTPRPSANSKQHKHGSVAERLKALPC